MASLKKRGKTYYAQYYIGSKQKRVCLDTTSLQLAKEKLRQIESSLLRGRDELPLPTKTPVSTVVAAYVEHILTVKTFKSAQTDFYYLRESFGPACDGIRIGPKQYTTRTSKAAAKKVRHYIETPFFEHVTTADISLWLAAQVRRKGLAPKTANRYREILTRLYNWAISQYGIRMPGEQNPAAKVERYKEKAPRIRFLRLNQITEQIDTLKDYPQLQVIVALYIYAGLRREEALWLREGDVDFAAGPNGMIRVQAKHVGKEYWEPKTKVNRVVPISRALRGYLDRYEVPASEDGWFFPSPQGSRWDPDNFSQFLARVNKKAQLVWTCLDYRHTFGSQLAMKGESLYKISKLMGNSPEICRRHYATLIPESLVESVEFERTELDQQPETSEGQGHQVRNVILRIIK